MKKYFSIMLVSLLLLFLIGPVFAAVELKDEGVALDGTAGRIDITGDASASGLGYDKTIDIGQGARTIEAVAGHVLTVTAADDGKIFVFATRENATATLPNAVAGLYYTFVDGGNTFNVAPTISIDPATSDDTIVYLALDAGDQITSTGATGASTTVIGAANTWYITEMGATAWTDGGA